MPRVEERLGSGFALLEAIGQHPEGQSLDVCLATRRSLRPDLGYGH